MAVHEHSVCVRTILIWFPWFVCVWLHHYYYHHHDHSLFSLPYMACHNLSPLTILFSINSKFLYIFFSPFVLFCFVLGSSLFLVCVSFCLCFAWSFSCLVGVSNYLLVFYLFCSSFFFFCCIYLSIYLSIHFPTSWHVVCDGVFDFPSLKKLRPWNQQQQQHHHHHQQQGTPNAPRNVHLEYVCVCVCVFGHGRICNTIYTNTVKPIRHCGCPKV